MSVSYMHIGCQIHNRWLVAYTLVRNPSLIPLTASNLKNAKTLMKPHDPQSDTDIDEKLWVKTVDIQFGDLDKKQDEQICKA